MQVVLYRRNRLGRLILQGRSFANLRKLQEFFASRAASRWQWAEVDISADPAFSQVIHYTADDLRAMVIASSREPSAN
jgi:hypothetical protein